MLPAGLCVQVNADLCLVVINGEILVFFPLGEIKLKFSFVTNLSFSENLIHIPPYDRALY